MFFARRLNSGISYQAAPSGGNMSIRKTLGLMCLWPRASSGDSGFATARFAVANAARSWVAQEVGRMARDSRRLKPTNTVDRVGEAPPRIGGELCLAYLYQHAGVLHNLTRWEPPIG